MNTALAPAYETQPISSYDDAPHIVIWEITRACALACRHCRAEAIPHRNDQELDTREAFALVDQVAKCKSPLFVITGGDPLMRDDIYDIVEYAVSRGLRVAVSPSATGRLTPLALSKLAAAGCRRISLSLDAPNEQEHDAFRGVRGSFRRTLTGITDARTAGLEVQINTTIGRFNHHQMDELARVVQEQDAAMWSLFFLIAVGRAQAEEMLDAQETEAVFAQLYDISKMLAFPLKTTEAPHYRRYVMQHDISAASPRFSGIGDGRGFVFVSHIGEVYPSGFLPFPIGNVRAVPLLELYCDNPLMKRLRQPQTFGGKCGVCEFNTVCGGSRSRAYAVSNDPFAQEPSCAYIPEALRGPVCST